MVSGGAERNAHLYDHDGSPIRSACLGDGIEHVVTTARGAIWVGYFDEGVFGNNGWGGPGPRPIGAPGLNRYDDRLEQVWSNDAVDIVDCYAMVGMGEDCLLCPYTSWSITRSTPEGSVVSFENAIAGASAIAMQGDVVVLAGGYQGERERVVVGRLVPGVPGARVAELRPLGAGTLSLADGTWAPDTMVGRDGTLHVLAGSAWHAISVGQLTDALGAAPR